MKYRQLITGFVLIVVLALMSAMVQASENAQRLAGMWEEFSPSHNFVRFGKDGSWELYLRKGEIGELHSLKGNWELSDDMVLSITFGVGDFSRTLKARVEFRNDEMVVIDGKGTETRHHRYEKELPAAYRW